MTWSRWRCTRRSRFATSATRRTCFARCMTAPPARTATSAWKCRRIIAHDTAATIDEARRLWKAVARDNVMIKVPASTEGLPAIRELTSEGINVNITLLFGIERYEAVARAYIDGLSTFVENGGDPAQVCSVASFFVSRIDTMVDGMIATRLATATDAGLRTSLTDLLGTVAIANAKLAYQRYLALCRTAEWQRLAAKGAHPQRLLWASTSTKNPRYRDVRYVEELIGRDTVNTITPATLEAFRDHGRLRASLEDNIEDARATSRRARARRNLAQRRDRQAARRRRHALLQGLRQPARGGGPGATQRDHIGARPAVLHPAAGSCAPGFRKSSRIGRGPARSAVCGRGTPRSGLVPMRRAGWAGWTSPTTSWRTLVH